MLIGVDIGGTKCSVSVGCQDQQAMAVLSKQAFPTPRSADEALGRIGALIEIFQATYPIEAIGISCGGPLDAASGVVSSPPNLPGWDQVNVIEPLRARFQVPTWLENDANAGALAEWLWGAGRGSRNCLFLTCGTGMGAGFILDGRLYAGSNGLAGEVGHIRLAPTGPEGYKKKGSFEGFCSGGDIARLGRSLAQVRLARGERVAFCETPADLEAITAEAIALAAEQGDPLALQIWEAVGQRLGQGLALLVDLLNPDCIVLGSIYVRQRKRLEPVVMQVLAREALPDALSHCRIVPAALGELVGDIAALSVAWYHLCSADDRLLTSAFSPSPQD